MKKIFIYTIISMLIPFSFCRAEMKITGISPSSGDIGTPVTITGEDFSGVNKVLFQSSTSGYVESVISNLNGSSITTVVPSGAKSGKISVEISESGVYRKIESPTEFQIAKKVISFDFSPKTGKIGDEIILSTNNNFSGVNKVLFGGVSTIPITNNENFIQVLVPQNAKTGKVVVNTASGDIESSTDFVVKSSTDVTPTTSMTDTSNTSSKSNSSSSGSSVYTHPTIKFNGLVPVCNTGAINPDTGEYTSNSCDFEDLMALINKSINYILIVLATPIFAIIIIYVGFIYLTSGGNPNKVSSAKGILQNAILGYVIALAAWLIVKTLLTTFGYVDISQWF